ncbi:amidase [Novosphingobium sp. Chol11]|uniref:amidase n=1 Tax=Novosphingobium sp. Chol11 TaxID=1385763 RepID=UPI0025F679EB|nr:amidase [Novosphingobium sp. Chol11]
MALSDCLARIDERDAAVRGWVHIDRSAQGGAGPLAGLVLGVKDVIDVAGMPTTHGSPIYADHRALADATSVARLRAAGAVVLGKTVTAEFATYHPGPTANPRNLAHTPGGSSSGSAAVVADGQADFALGTQTAGSVIRPASFCGTLGFKPTFGRYPLGGVLETAPSLDTLGLFARNLAVLGAADAVLAQDSASPIAVSTLTIGLCRSPLWSLASAPMMDAFLAFAAGLQAADHCVIDIELPAPFAWLSAAQALIHRREAALMLGYIRRDHPAQVSAAFAAMIDQGEAEKEADYQAALALQRKCTALCPEVFAQADLLLVPGAPGTAPAGLSATGDPAFQRIWTAIGVPCLGFPAAWGADGLPLGLQIIAAPGTDRQLFANAPAILAHAAFREI